MPKINLSMFERGASQVKGQVSYSSNSEEVTLNAKFYHDLKEKAEERRVLVDELKDRVDELDELNAKLEAQLLKYLPTVDSYLEKISVDLEKNIARDLFSSYSEDYFKSLPSDMHRLKIANYLIDSFNSMEVATTPYWHKIVSNAGALV